MPPRKREDTPSADAPRPLPTRGSLAGPRRPRRGFVPATPPQEPRKGGRP